MGLVKHLIHHIRWYEMLIKQFKASVFHRKAVKLLRLYLLLNQNNKKVLDA